jgi:predicted ATPase
MIRKVCIRNYRRFREFDIEFLPGINVLVGCNGSRPRRVVSKALTSLHN